MPKNSTTPGQNQPNPQAPKTPNKPPAPKNSTTLSYYPLAILAQAYVLVQTYDKTFSPEEALEKGTLFPELYRPYPY